MNPIVAKIGEASEILVESGADLSRALSKARELSGRIGRLGIITLEATPGGQLSLVVGGDESVLSFQETLDPPYYASKGASEEDQPFMECFLFFEHHTEFSRSAVISSAISEQAAFEFLETRRRPQCVQWQEV